MIKPNFPSWTPQNWQNNVQTAPKVLSLFSSILSVSGPQQPDLSRDGAAASHHLQAGGPGQPVREPDREGREQDQGDPGGDRSQCPGGQWDVTQQHWASRHHLRGQRGRHPVHLSHLCHHVRGKKLLLIYLHSIHTHQPTSLCTVKRFSVFKIPWLANRERERESGITQLIIPVPAYSLIQFTSKSCSLSVPGRAGQRLHKWNPLTSSLWSGNPAHSELTDNQPSKLTLSEIF